MSEIQDDEGNIVYTIDCENMASARVYVLHTHRAVAGVVVRLLAGLLVKLPLARVLVAVWAQKPNIVEVFVESFCCDIRCEYVCRVV